MDWTPEQINGMVKALGPTLTLLMVGGVALSKILDFFKVWGMNKMNGRLGGYEPNDFAEAIAKVLPEYPPYPSCFYDPQHFDRVKTIETKCVRNNEMLEDWDDKIQQGAFGCAWTNSQVIHHMRDAKD